MYVAFYKAKYGTLLDRWISWVTWGPYSHCELVFRDGLWFSSSPRDGGTRFKRIEFDDSHWDFIEIPLDLERERVVRDFCEVERGKPYDWAGAIFRLPFINGRWFCSEICFEALSKSVKLKGESFWATPNSLWKTLRAGYKLNVQDL